MVYPILNKTRAPLQDEHCLPGWSYKTVPHASAVSVRIDPLPPHTHPRTHNTQQPSTYPDDHVRLCGDLDLEHGGLHGHGATRGVQALEAALDAVLTPRVPTGGAQSAHHHAHKVLEEVVVGLQSVGEQHTHRMHGEGLGHEMAASCVMAGAGRPGKNSTTGVRRTIQKAPSSLSSTNLTYTKRRHTHKRC